VPRLSQRLARLCVARVLEWAAVLGRWNLVVRAASSVSEMIIEAPPFSLLPALGVSPQREHTYPLRLSRSLELPLIGVRRLGMAFRTDLECLDIEVRLVRCATAFD
jgi:hypothetical protein